MFDSKFHGYQSTKLQLSYEIMFSYVQKLQIAHLIPLKTINIVSYNKFSKPRPGWAGPVFRLNPTKMFKRTLYTHAHTHTHSRFTAILDFVRDHPGEQVPERQNQKVKPIWIYWSKR